MRRQARARGKGRGGCNPQLRCPPTPMHTRSIRCARPPAAKCCREEEEGGGYLSPLLHRRGRIIPLLLHTRQNCSRLRKGRADAGHEGKG